MSRALRRACSRLSRQAQLSGQQRSVICNDGVLGAALATGNACPEAGSNWFRTGAVGVLLAAGGLQLALAEEEQSAPAAEEARTAIRQTQRGDHIGNEHTAQWRIYTDLGRKSAIEGDSKKAEQYLRQALQEAKEGFGDHDAHVAAAQNNLAELYRVMHQFDKAETLYVEALQKLLKSFGPDDLRVAQAYSNAASCLVGQNNMHEARAYLEKALQVRKAALGERHVAVAASLKPLALMHWRMGEHDAAISLQRECCSIMTPEDDAEPAHTYAPGWMRESGDLFAMLLASQRWQQAAEVQQQRLQRLLPAAERNIFDISAMEQLADALHMAGKAPEARSQLQECLSLLTARDGPTSISAGVTLQHLAELELDGQEQASWQRAHNLARQSCDILGEAVVAIADIAQRPQKPPGWFTWFKGDPPETDAVAQKARTALPAALLAHARSLQVLGCTQHRLGRRQEAWASLVRGLQVLLDDSARPVPLAGRQDNGAVAAILRESDTDDEVTPRLLAVLLLGSSVGRTQKVGPMTQQRRQLKQLIVTIQHLADVLGESMSATAEPITPSALPTGDAALQNLLSGLDATSLDNSDTTEVHRLLVTARQLIRIRLAKIKQLLTSMSSQR